MKLNGYLLRSVAVAALTGRLFGFDTVVINGATEQLKALFKLDEFWLGFTVTSALIGTIAGSMIAGKPADAFGRRTALVAIAVVYFVSSLGSALAGNWASFLVFRFLRRSGHRWGLGGLAALHRETPPANYRGRLVAITQFNVVAGILLAFFSNLLISKLGFAPPSGVGCWEWLRCRRRPSSSCCSSRPTARVGWWRRAGSTRPAVYLCARAENVEQELREIHASLETSRHSIKEPLFRKAYLRPILLAMAIAAFNQLSGINALLYYAVAILKMAGVGTDVRWWRPWRWEAPTYCLPWRHW